MASFTDALNSKNDTAISKAVVDSLKENAGLNKQTPSPSPLATPNNNKAAPLPPSPALVLPSPPTSLSPSSSNSVETTAKGTHALNDSQVSRHSLVDFPLSFTHTNTPINTGTAGTREDKPPHSLPIGAIVGLVVGAVAIALLVAAFVIWYRRLRQSSSTSTSARTSSSVNNKHRKAPTGSLTADFETLDTSRMLPDGLVPSCPNRTGSNAWDDDVITAARIPLEKVTTLALLARGGFGEVYRGTYKATTVAIKKLLPATRKDLKHIESFFCEVKLMATLEHERIVTFVGVAWDALSDVCVLSEFMAGGDVRTLLMRFEVQEQRQRGFDSDKIRIALHVVHALTYLHSLQPIVLHRDLKSKNILLDTQLNAKLTDFGVSREQSDATMTAGVGTSLWMAPEVMLGEKYDEKSDIFSFGVVLSELDSHLLPYAHAKHADSGQKLTDTAILQLVSMGRLRVDFSDSVAPELRALGESCVAVDPSERPTAAEALYKLQVALKAAWTQ